MRGSGRRRRGQRGSYGLWCGDVLLRCKVAVRNKLNNVVVLVRWRCLGHWQCTVQRPALEDIHRWGMFCTCQLLAHIGMRAIPRFGVPGLFTGLGVGVGTAMLGGGGRAVTGDLGLEDSTGECL